MSNLSDFLNSGKKMKVQEFLTSGTWTRPAGVDAVHLFLVGGGAGGSSCYSDGSVYYESSGGGGAGGSVIDKTISVTGDLVVTIGAGGAGAVTNYNYGSDGGNSSVSGGASFTALGGGGNSIQSGGRNGSGDSGTGTSYASSGSGGGAGGSPITHGYNVARSESKLVTPTPASGIKCGFSGTFGVSYAAYYSEKAGPGINGFGCGAPGNPSGANFNSQALGCGFSSEGVASTPVNSNGFNAPANTGNGGGGGHRYSSSVIFYNGGNGGSGYCKIVWFE